MVLMTACYTAMGRVLWGSRSIGEMTQRQIDSIKSKRKVSIFNPCKMQSLIYSSNEYRIKVIYNPLYFLRNLFQTSKLQETNACYGSVSKILRFSKGYFPQIGIAFGERAEEQHKLIMVGSTNWRHCAYS